MIVKTYQIFFETRYKVDLTSGIRVSDGKVIDSSPQTSRWIGETFEFIKKKCKKNKWKITLSSTQTWKDR